jgi:hypothetical protein
MENKPILSHQAADSSSTPLARDDNKSGTSGTRSSQIVELSKACKKRHILAFYSFAGFFLAYSMRANLSVAIVEMSKINMVKYEVNVTGNGLNDTDLTPVIVNTKLITNKR